MLGFLLGLWRAFGARRTLMTLGSGLGFFGRLRFGAFSLCGLGRLGFSLRHRFVTLGSGFCFLGRLGLGTLSFCGLGRLLRFWFGLRLGLCLGLGFGSSHAFVMLGSWLGRLRFCFRAFGSCRLGCLGFGF